jgi:hypothetical protein
MSRGGLKKDEKSLMICKLSKNMKIIPKFSLAN